MFVSSATPFQLEVSRYAGRFARAVYLGDPPPFSPSSVMHSATLTVLKFDQLLIGVTCHHVLKYYRKLKHDNPLTIFQIGKAELDPLQHLISEDRERDLAILDLSPFAGDSGSLDESNVIEPVFWPPADVVEDDVVCLAGFPGIWREQTTCNELRFQWFSSGAAFVKSVAEERFVVGVRPEEPIVTVNKGLTPSFLGGLSGGPVFCWRKTDKLFRAELVGFIYEYNDNFDLMYVRSARVMNSNGTLT